jgi:gamma-glutamylcyclotransferase
MLYFSYGSNMSTPRLAARAPAARAVGVAKLQMHGLSFRKKGKDGSAKCDAVCTNDRMDVVYGVVFRISAAGKAELDRQEGLKNGYEEKVVRVVTRDGKALQAVTYYATRIEPGLKPYEWYKEHVLRGAREHGLPAEYIQAIASVEAVPDPDRRRHARELSIYRPVGNPGGKQVRLRRTIERGN